MPLRISSTLTLKILKEYNIKDNTDAMRVNILALEIAGGNHTVETLKKSQGYLCCVNDISFSDEYLQSLLDEKKDLVEFFAKQN